MSSPFSKFIRIAFWTLSIALGAAQAWRSRFIIVNDVISYLDMGYNFFHGQWAAIINGLWSPFYAFLLGAILTTFRPSAYWEFPVVHLIVFFIFLLTLVCFEFFLHQFATLREDHASERRVADWPWLVIAYVIFLWSSLSLIGVDETNPDMLIAALFYLSCGLIIRIYQKRASWITFVGLGLALGVAYLTKAVMLPISLILMASAWLVTNKGSRKKNLITALVFVLTVTPYVVGLSLQKGHLSVGESGKYNYAVHVNGVPRLHWQGDGVAGAPLHPTREIFTVPTTFEFKGPIPGTYPAWFDPSYWYAGVRTPFDLKHQVRAAVKNLFGELHLVLDGLNGVLFVTLFLLLYVGEKGPILGKMARWSFLTVPAILPLGLYTLVHYEPRYVCAFYVVLGVLLFSSVLWSSRVADQRLFCGVAIIQVIVLIWSSGIPTFRSLRSTMVPERGALQETAENVRRMGLSPGDQIATLDFSNLGAAMWAHLARVQIIAEVYYWPGGPEGSAKSFWDTDQLTQDEVLHRMSEIGAKAVVSSDAPTGPGASRWLRIGNTAYYLLWLDRPAVAAQEHRSK
jgi:hypothetical protein